MTAAELELIATAHKDEASLTPEQSTKIKFLMSELKQVSAPVKNSIFSKLYRRNELRAMISYFNLPSLWFTLNPADNRNPLVAVLSGHTVDQAIALSIFERCKLIVDDPVAPCKYFYCCVNTFISILKGGIFGPLKAYYGIIETQGRGSLHIHMLIWLDEAPPNEIFANALLHDQVHRDNLCCYANSILSATITSAEKIPSICTSFPTTIENQQDIAQFDNIVSAIVQETNMHSASHNAACFKRNNKSCRFNFPRPCQERTTICLDSLDVVPTRNNPWINPYNKYIAYLFRCNHDIILITSGSDTKALIYYLTEYATKCELKTYELVSLMSAAYKDVEENSAVLMESDKTRKLLIRCLNKIGSVQEQPAQLVISDLLGYPTHYTDSTFASLNWLAIVKYIEDGDDDVTLLQQNPLYDRPVTKVLKTKFSVLTSA